MILATLVAGGSPGERENAIAQRLETTTETAVILEGMPTGNSTFDDNDKVRVARIAAGCPCCAGNLVLRVTLNRILQARPARLFIGISSEEHLEALRSFLCASPYKELLELTQDVRTGSH